MRKFNDIKIGYVYFIQCENLIKIGFSQNIERRIKQLNTANGNKLRLIYYIEGTKDTEYYIHRKYSEYKVKGEWYEAVPILKAIERDKLTKRVLKETGIIK